MKNLIIILLMFISVLSFGQAEKRFSAVAEFGSFVAVNDSIWRGSISSWSDPLNEGYLPSQIAVGYMAIDATGKMYRVKVINSTTFSSANLDIVELQNSTAPIGAGSIFNPLTYDVIPPAVSNSLGITPVVRSKIDIHNAVKLSAGLTAAAAAGGGGTTLSKDTLTAGGTTMVIRYFGTGTLTLTEPSAGNYTLAIPSGNTPAGFHWTGINTDTDGTGDMTLNIVSSNADDNYGVINIINRGNNQIVDLQALGITIAQNRSSAGTVAYTLTSMSGFGASGFNILARF